MDSSGLPNCALCGKRMTLTREEIMYGETDVERICQSCFQLALKKTAQRAGPLIGPIRC